MGARGPIKKGIKAAAESQAGALRCPPGLSEAEQYQFKVITSALAERGVLDPIDARPLARYCKMVSKYDELCRYVEERGVASGLSAPKEERAAMSSALRLLAVYEARISAIEQLWGMSAAARMRGVCGKEDKVPDERDRFFKS